jgi:MacB-like protein
MSTRLRFGDLARVASVGVRTRRLRAALSALGIAIGVAAIVAVLGLASSSQAGLLAEIDRLGTNLLTVTDGQNLLGDTAELPIAAPGMIARIGRVTETQYTGSTSAKAYRSPHIPVVNTNAITVKAASLGLLPTVATTVAQGVISTPQPRRNRLPCSALPPHSDLASTAPTRARGAGSATSGSTSPASSTQPCSLPRSTPRC